MEKTRLSVAEAADLLNISRIAVHKRIKAGTLSAERIGRSFVIPAEEVLGRAAGTLTDRDRKEIDAAVARVVKEYGTALKMLGKE